MTEITINAASEKFGCEQRSLKKWIAADGIKPTRTEGRRKFYDEAELKQCVYLHKQSSSHRSLKENIDPETGLTWSQRKSMEEAKALARENRRADMADSREWMRTEDHFRILRALLDRLEQLPGKCKSEFGLSLAQENGLRKTLDQIRSEARDEVATMNHKKEDTANENNKS